MGAQFQLWAQDAAGHDAGPMIYESPALTKYPYDGCHDKEGCYSPSATSLSASCSGCTGKYIAIKFVNNKRNMQLLLPLTITINEIAWGVPFLLLFGLAAGFYIGGGIALGVRRYGASKGGGLGSTLSMHLHYRHWVEVVALCSDGVLFASRRSGVGGLGDSGKRGYTPVARSAVPPSLQPVPARAATGPSHREKKSKRERKGEQQGKKQKSDKRDGGSSEAPSLVASPPAPTPAPAPAPAAGLPGTAAGGGGRWVHVPN